jgi:hypothetical protein
MARGRGTTGDEAITTAGPANPAPGLEGLPRTDIDRVEHLVPSFVEAALRSPLVLTRHGREAFVLMPLDVYRRFWSSVPRPPLIEGQGEDESGGS